MKKLLLIAALLMIFVPTGTAMGNSSLLQQREALDPPVGGYPAVTRFWSDTYKGHFYTADAVEAAAVEANYPDDVWRGEGTSFYVFANWLCDLAELEGPLPPGVCVPVYRFWSDTYKHHFYTISETEKNNIMLNMPEWQYEGMVYSANTGAFGYASVPLYRFWSDAYKGHFYTISAAEKNNIAANMPEWQYEGVAYYVMDYYSRPPGV